MPDNQELRKSLLNQWINSYSDLDLTLPSASNYNYFHKYLFFLVDFIQR